MVQMTDGLKAPRRDGDKRRRHRLSRHSRGNWRDREPARPTRVGDNSRILRLALGSSPARPLGVGYDVFRAFTTRGARRIVMVDSLDKALELRNSEFGRRRLLHRREGERQTAGLRLRQFTGRVATCRSGREDADPDDNQWDSWHQRRPRCRSHLRGRLGDGRGDRTSDPAQYTSRDHPGRHGS